jgi:hypothetical protein
LSERLAYERASHTQKMRTEVSQAKREADFYRNNAEKSRRLLKRSKTDNSTADEPSHRLYEFRQKETDDVLRSKRPRMDEPSVTPEDDHSPSKKNKKKKAKDKKRHSVDATSPHAKNRKSPKSKKNLDELSGEGPPSKRARTRSSDRKDFLQSVFGSKA